MKRELATACSLQLSERGYHEARLHAPWGRPEGVTARPASVADLRSCDLRNMVWLPSRLGTAGAGGARPRLSLVLGP
jgi:hypothetical protein